MRASRVARETARLFKSESSSSPSKAATTTTTPLRRSTRGSALAQRFSYKEEDHDDEKDEEDDETKVKLQLRLGEDIEDAVFTTATVARKRKSSPLAPPPSSRRRTATTRIKTESSTVSSSSSRASTRTSAARTKPELHSDSELSWLSDSEADSTKPAPKKKGRVVRNPARVTTTPSGSRIVKPPSNWEEIYNLVKEMRISGPAANAAVDTMGCERLALPTATPLERRFHTLVALMLSSQTKDTVNAEAMRRLQTELPPFAPGAPAGLNLDNMLAVDPVLLDDLIGKVGFHNRKTEYLKKTAIILKEKWGGDIPPTVEGLISLPGVGPKMAHLCMSAEAGWNQVTGIGVDVHVHRITNLWGWQSPPSKSPEETRASLESWLPRDKWKEINWLLVGFGQAVCLPVGRKCGECEVGLKGLCKSADRAKVNAGRIKREQRELVKMEVEEAGVEVGIEEDGDDEVVFKWEGISSRNLSIPERPRDGDGDVVMEEGELGGERPQVAVKREEGVDDTPAVKREPTPEDRKDVKIEDVKKEEDEDSWSEVPSEDSFGPRVRNDEAMERLRDAEDEVEAAGGQVRWPKREDNDEDDAEPENVVKKEETPEDKKDIKVERIKKEEDDDLDDMSLGGFDPSRASSEDSFGSAEVKNEDAMERLRNAQEWNGLSDDDDDSEPENVVKDEPGVIARIKREPVVKREQRRANGNAAVVKREPLAAAGVLVENIKPERDAATTSRFFVKQEPGCASASAPVVKIERKIKTERKAVVIKKEESGAAAAPVIVKRETRRRAVIKRERD
ncbi:hypothetical protein QBC35DRAFT_486568 [Podospora australis]|uniref:Endonuclease III homolog n=1 Tax=Podospora australis TaxID=1536484 RepID=A0AAN6X093_9PEZI|nr:hypothetical protein QBC35DRAFT_486568 [Podospora australis]